MKGTVEKRQKWGFSLENQIIRDQLKFVLYAALKQNAINDMNLCTHSCLKLTQIKWSIANLLNQLASVRNFSWLKENARSTWTVPT